MRLIFTNDSLLRRLLCLCLCLAMLFSLVPAGASLAEGEILLETRYDSPGSDKQRVWQFPYSDELFYGASGVYNHTLAQSSLGMALSAFRSKHIGQDEQDKAARAYLTGAGFSELVSADYEKIPTIDTVSTLIGEKKMDGFTLVAVAVCGGGYGNEWTSNFTIGNGERHEGFNDASMKVQARIREYLSGHGITGSVKLWIAGYKPRGGNN
ncbi:MAG: hypothetical protein PHI27_11825 [Eubacteriales bacterium]|nr:hypothetical protein [Eubacteriales bacterium]MDD3882918.1 hypothetical protein [Eubacteriales bacterium]MDD4513908.1 hypothetical protein [Eubacteriales bacterium]